MTNENKKLGNAFERELCNLLASCGFWAHNLAQNAAGQPFDVICARNGRTYVIDCKVCSGDRFALSRMEENQINSMRLWAARGNGYGYYAVKFQRTDNIYMIRGDILLKHADFGAKSLSESVFRSEAFTISGWLSCM